MCTPGAIKTWSQQQFPAFDRGCDVTKHIFCCRLSTLLLPYAHHYSRKRSFFLSSFHFGVCVARKFYDCTQRTLPDGCISQWAYSYTYLHLIWSHRAFLVICCRRFASYFLFIIFFCANFRVKNIYIEWIVSVQTTSWFIIEHTKFNFCDAAFSHYFSFIRNHELVPRSARQSHTNKSHANRKISCFAKLLNI